MFKREYILPFNILVLILLFPACSVTQLCLTLCDPMTCSLPGTSVHGILQARILEWGTIFYSRESSWQRISSISCIGKQILYHCALLSSTLLLIVTNNYMIRLQMVTFTSLKILWHIFVIIRRLWDVFLETVKKPSLTFVHKDTKNMGKISSFLFKITS